MKVLHLCLRFPPEWSGGIAVFAQMLGLEHARLGHEVSFLCNTGRTDFKPGEIVTEWMKDCSVSRVRIRKGKAGKDDLRAFRLRIIPFLRNGRFDVVHVHTITGLSSPLKEAARRVKIPVVATLHNGLWVCPNFFFENNISAEHCLKPGLAKCFLCLCRGPEKKFSSGEIPKNILHALKAVIRTKTILRRDLENFDGIVACCEYIKTQYKTFGVRKQIEVISNRVKTDEIHFKRMTAHRRPLRIGLIGGFRKFKGNALLLESLSLLKERYGEFRIEVWGPSPDFYLGEYAAILREAPFSFHGFYDRSSLNEILKNIDVMVNTSTWDVYSTVILESLASRTPVIAVRATGTVEMIRDGENGFMFERNNPADLADKLRAVLDRPSILQLMQARMRRPPCYGEMVDAYLEAYGKYIAGYSDRC
jgi:glycosyltransferase involved in cell wall biosynthesis